jgi:hypothetical protein
MGFDKSNFDDKLGLAKKIALVFNSGDIYVCEDSYSHATTAEYFAVLIVSKEEGYMRREDLGNGFGTSMRSHAEPRSPSHGRCERETGFDALGSPVLTYCSPLDVHVFAI